MQVAGVEIYFLFKYWFACLFVCFCHWGAFRWYLLGKKGVT